MRWPRRRAAAAERFAAIPGPGDALPWREAEWCAIDLELTGLRRSDEIISIGAVPIRDGALILGEAVYTLARPERPPGHASVPIHKLRFIDLQGAPALEEAIEALMSALAGRVPVFHTAMIERSFLGRELHRRGVQLPDDADTEVLGRVWLGRRGQSTAGHLPLAALARALGQPAEDAHHALGDALTTGKAFIALASHLDTLSPQTVGTLRGAREAPPVRSGRFGLV